MMVLHEENSHYNLIIPNSSRLATEGGLDFQRKEEVNEFQEMNVEKSKSDHEMPLNYLQEKIDLLEDKCNKLQVENKKLVHKLQKHEQEKEIINNL